MCGGITRSAAVAAYNECVLRIAAFAGVVVVALGLGAWYYTSVRVPSAPPVAEQAGDDWLDHIYSQNPNEAADAARHVEQLGARALPAIHGTLQNPDAEPEQVKAALKACAILGPEAAPAIAEVAENLTDPELTAEAAVALSFMGRGAFAPLRDALTSDAPTVRRESLRSIGKLKDRAPLDARAVLPLLVSGLSDTDAGVRSVAATYLGIVHEGGGEVVNALAAGLSDPEPSVRRAAAAALSSFGADAEPALPALRKAMADADEEVAREAGLTLVKLQPAK